jgi:hypothetical protein
MLKLKKFFLAFAMVAALGWATSASAQVGFQVSADSQDVNVDSLAAGVGQILLSAISNGDIVNDSTISVDFGVDIISSDLDPDFADPAAPVTINIASLDCDAIDATVDIDGSVLTIQFTDVCSFAVGDNIVFSGIRVNANDAGVGATIDGEVSAVVPSGFAATNPITFLGDTSPEVAEVMEPFEIEIEQGRTLLTCADNPSEDETGDETLKTVITISELFNQAFASSDDELGLADYGVAGLDVEVGQTFTVTFSNVPEGVFIWVWDTDSDPSITIDEFGPVEGDGGDIEFNITIDSTNSSGSNEDLEIQFESFSDDPLDLVGGSQDIDVAVSYAAAELADGEVPEYVENEVSDLGFVLSDCLTRLLLSWAAVNASGFDTGATFANTSEDDLAYGALDSEGAIAQSGTCTLTGYKSTDGSTVQFTTPTIEAGETFPLVLSSVSGFNGFTGYILTVCNFLNAHSFAFITNGFGSVTGPTLAEGAQWNVVPLGSRTHPNGESLDH